MRLPFPSLSTLPPTLAKPPRYFPTLISHTSTTTTPYYRPLSRSLSHPSQPHHPQANHSTTPPPPSSKMSSPAPAQYVTVTPTPSGYALLTIHRNPVNSMNTLLWSQLQAALDRCEQDPNIRGLILTSGLSRPVFTAGNDLTEIFAPMTSREQYARFWTVSNQFLARLYRSPLITAAAIHGACPAGGTAMSMACDHRSISLHPASSMGLNEVAIGIPVPAKWAQLMATLTGQGEANRLCGFGKMVDAAEAKRIGLVDSLVDGEGKEVVADAVRWMEKTLRLPDVGRVITKAHFRDRLSREWEDEEWLRSEAEGAWEMLASDEVVTVLGGVMQRMSGKAKI
ncbi:ClpP/crotonase-like domain-containing protein [Fimicolochytrium jonesii]|uniref:ClpP/crotonase-like domain-containing protein n=1 Tax=Fimicolochytrium jonesii TaxID=1396493 RepID=UPI0022FEE0D6|nr:ClpP/crotonase-like domain-containing protein [Fimicolochytrium jonesii]KAI8820260.1 ClpP/crotonase-like domain-containing protein [Fimicolochytrium jonesii]